MSGIGHAFGGVASGAASGAATSGPAGAAIGAGASVLGSALGYFGGKGAARSQERMANEALRYQREIEAQRRREYEERQRIERERQDELDRRRAPYRQASLDLLSRWGYAPQQDWAATPDVTSQSQDRPYRSTGNPGTLGYLARG